MLLFYLKTGVKQIWFVFTVLLLYVHEHWPITPSLFHTPPVNVVVGSIPLYDDDDSNWNKNNNNNVNDRYLILDSSKLWNLFCSYQRFFDNWKNKKIVLGRALLWSGKINFSRILYKTRAVNGFNKVGFSHQRPFYKTTIRINVNFLIF